MEMVYRKGQSQLYFLRRLRSFNISRHLLCSIFQTVVASALFFAVVCWGEGAHMGDISRVNKLKVLVKKAGFVVCIEFDTVQQVAERRILSKLRSIMNNPSHSLHALGVMNSSNFSHRLIAPKCKSEHSRKSFLSVAIRCVMCCDDNMNYLYCI